MQTVLAVSVYRNLERCLDQSLAASHTVYLKLLFSALLVLKKEKHLIINANF